MDIKLVLISFIGIFIFCLVAWISSENKKIIPWSLIVSGIVVQFLLCLLFFLFPMVMSLLLEINNFPGLFYEASDAGSRFLFGASLVPKDSVKLGSLINELTGEFDIQKLVNPNTNLISSNRISFGFVFAFRSIPSIIFFSALFSLAYRMNLMQPIVKLFAKLFQFKVKLSGAETLAGVSNIFLGLESALVVFPYLKTMTRSELAAFLTCSFGTISSTVFGMYAAFLKPSVPEITNHFMLASVLTIPACFIMAKIIVPESETPITLGDIPVESKKKKGFLASVLVGGMDGGRIVFGIIVGVIVVTGIVALLNSFFDSLSSFKDSESLPLQSLYQYVSIKVILGAIFFPLTFFTGISFQSDEIWIASVLIGQRVFQTSIPSYIQLQQLHGTGEISDRGLIIISYVLCGFAHIPAIGIFIGGLSGLMPRRMEEICSLTWKALWAATLATLMTGAFAGLFSFKL